jgi:hypothetical protein
VAARRLVAAHCRRAAVCTLAVRYTTVYRRQWAVQAIQHTAEGLQHRAEAAPHQKESRFPAAAVNPVQADIFHRPVQAEQHHFEWMYKANPHYWLLAVHIHSELHPNQCLDCQSPLAVRSVLIQCYKNM